MRARFWAVGAAPAVAAGLLVPGMSPAHGACEIRDVPAPKASSWRARADEIRRLDRWHAFRDSARWRLTRDGVVLCGDQPTVPPKERYRIELVPEAWARYGPLIRAAARRYRVPAELIIAVMINESALKPESHQKYRGYVSDDRTPHRISVGLGATLISTARYMLDDDAVDRVWLTEPENAIRMIGLYLDRYYSRTGFDPPRLAAAYNAGGLYHDPSKRNRWRLRSHPIGRGLYIDYFVAVTNAAMRMLARRADRPPESFASIFYGAPELEVAVEIPETWTHKSGKLVLYRAPRDQMGVASSSIIDHKARRREPGKAEACQIEGASCPAARRPVARRSEPPSASR